MHHLTVLLLSAFAIAKASTTTDDEYSTIDKTLALAPKFTGFLSLCSSAFIVQHVLRNKSRRGLVYHRLIMSMSISDCFGSSSAVFSTWPMPRGDAYLAAGTVQTCSAMGFFDQTAALCTITYNVSLATYYILVVVCGWKEIRVVKIEKYLHALPILAGLGTGFTALGMKLLNASPPFCWIGPGLPNHPERHNPNYEAYRLAFLYVPVWIIICFLAIAMIIIYRTVLNTERKLDKYMTRRLRSISAYATVLDLSVKKKRDKSRKVRNQACLYVGCLYCCMFFATVFRLMQFAGKTPPDSIAVLFVITYPLQGFFNLIVYMYPRIVRYFETGTRFTAPFAESRVLSSMRGGLSLLRSFGDSRRSTTETSETETVGQVISQLSRFGTAETTVEVSEPSTSGAKPYDTKMKKQVSFAITPSVQTSVEMAADTVEDLAGDGQHLDEEQTEIDGPPTEWRNEDEAVDFNPELVDHQRRISWPPTILQRTALDELWKAVEA